MECRPSGGVIRVHFFFFFQAEDGIRDYKVTGVQTCALPIYLESVFSFEGAIDLFPQLVQNFARALGNRNVFQMTRSRQVNIEFPLDASRTKSRSEEHTSELQSPCNLVSRLLFETKTRNGCSI